MNASKKIYKCTTFVPDKYYAKFTVFEDDLRELGYSARDYAYTTLTIMQSFVLGKGWKYLPINTFLGDYCLSRYKKVVESETVVIERVSDDEIIMSDELLVAQMFIDRNKNADNLIRLSAVVEELKPLLSRVWLDTYNNRRARPEAEVVNVLARMYRISKPVSNYLDIVSAIR